MNALGNLLKLIISVRKNTGLKKIPKKILVFKPGAIGDILWTTPFLRQLRKRFPKSEIVYCVGKWSKDVLEGNPNIDRMIIIDDSRLMRKSIIYSLKLIRELRKERFDAVFTFEKHYLSNLFIWATRIPMRIGFDRFGEGFPLNLAVPYGNDKHEIEYDLDLLTALDGKILEGKDKYVKSFGKDYFQTEVFPRKDEIKKIDSLFRRNRIKGKIVGLAPGGGKNTGQETMFRRWPIKKYAELARRLLDKGHTVLIFGGATDIDLAKSFDKRCVDLIGMLGSRESVVAMGKCDYFICNDSGPMNMAAASDGKVRIISLFGPTRPDRKAPIASRHISIWKDKDIYYPEYDLFGRVIRTEKFMERISVDDVLKRISKK